MATQIHAIRNWEADWDVYGAYLNTRVYPDRSMQWGTDRRTNNAGLVQCDRSERQCDLTAIPATPSDTMRREWVRGH
ncbi:hypothetical protein R1flu_006100 [Riccia fluitans]|uniref:Uncharacterized protein n=1 Tax=Riccia fluitans TaxID=41844 RepID=A0ABD1YV28_9MARC